MQLNFNSASTFVEKMGIGLSRYTFQKIILVYGELP